MRNLLYIALLIEALLATGSAVTLVEEAVWIDGSSFYKSHSKQKGATIYFEEWSPFTKQLIEDKNYYIALQLSSSFNPFPQNQVELPNIRDLSSIGDSLVIQKYFGFLESYGRAHGISHMVLPDTSGYDQLQKNLISKANEHSPYYFLSRSLLSRSLPNNKKEFVDSENSTIWITEQYQSLSKLNRWSNKLGEDKRQSFYKQLEKAKDAPFIPAYELPEFLAESVFRSSVVAIDPYGYFPLKSKAICYLGEDLELQQWLSKYVPVFGYRREGMVTIVDNRITNHESREGDIVITRATEEIAFGKNSLLMLPTVAIEKQALILSKMLFGAEPVMGLSVNPYNRILQAGRLGWSDPDFEGLKAEELKGVDSIASEAISKFATPGMQLAVVKNGSFVFQKSYGYLTYDSLKAVENSTLYDVASLTKVIATLPAVALLVDQGKISLDDTLGMHIPAFAQANKSHITIRRLLAHQAGLAAYIPFWSMMMDGDRLDAFYYKTPEDEKNDIRSYGLQPDPIMVDSLKSFIVRSDLNKNNDEYRYSDLGFMILHLLVEEVSGVGFDAFVSTHFFEPMQMDMTRYNPVAKGHLLENIAPTEFDQRYRNYQVWGEVHDRNALVFGGVAGHAGLFSTASDLAKMMYMLHNGGSYGGRQYISRETLDSFNHRYFENNRRGLGWDKKDGKKDAASKLASDRSYGHTGFTGSMVWADPESDLIYIFLSNRIYPDAENWRLAELNTRTRIHDVLYKALGD